MALKSYHRAWLSVHPHRTVDWLKQRLSDGFDVHHINGDHSDDTPENLVLIECVDHMRIHGSPNFLRISLDGSRRRFGARKCGGRPRGRSVVVAHYRAISNGETDGSRKPEGYPLPLVIDPARFSGSDLQSWRTAMDMNMGEAAEVLGISPDSYSRMEKRPVLTRRIALACYAISLGLPPAIG